ncbi:MAG: AsmA family protein [Pseudomonadota bacterium]
MNTPAAAPRSTRSVLLKIGVAALALVALIAVVLVFFPWDTLRGPLNRYVSERTGRHFEITRKLDVRLGRTTTVIADGIEFANPSWARDPYLLQAEGAEIQVRLWPLLSGRFVLPRVALRQPRLGLQLEADGRRTWALGKDGSDERRVPEIGTLVVDQGSLTYFAPGQGADIRADVALAPESTARLPLSFKASGKYKGEAFNAQGKTGGVLEFSEDTRGDFPVDFQLQSGQTRLAANGSLTNLSQLGGIDASVELQGRSLEDLYHLLGVVLPGSPAYKLQGKLKKEGLVWNVQGLKGRFGNSDLAGDLVFDRSRDVPRLAGKLQSARLDFEDLGPMIGVTPGSPTPKRSSPGEAPAQPGKSGKPDKRPAQSGKVLPDTKLQFGRLKTMTADVNYTAAKVLHMKALPLDSISVGIKLDNGVLVLDPLKMGVAGGQMAGRLGINSHVTPAAIDVKLDARGLQLNQLFPSVETSKSSLGRVSGNVELKGSGNSTAQLLATSSGTVSFLMGRGEISNILLEFMGLDGGEIIKFLIRGDRNVNLRCAAVAFDVNKGVMNSRVFLLDTVDTVVHGRGNINLDTEAIDLLLEPEPKDASIFSLRSPLKITGTLGAPDAGPVKSALAGRAGIAIALAAINPLLALAATIETGPGQDADCAQVLKQASAKAPPAK